MFNLVFGPENIHPLFVQQQCRAAALFLRERSGLLLPLFLCIRGSFALMGRQWSSRRRGENRMGLVA